MPTRTHARSLVLIIFAFGALLLGSCTPPEEPPSIPSAGLLPEPDVDLVFQATATPESVLDGTQTTSATRSDSPPNREVMVGDDRPARLASLTKDWGTDWTRHTIDYDEIMSGGPPRDGIPSIDDPKFVTIAEAEAWLVANEPVIALEIEGDSRAYPLQILTWHEIANDVVGSVPVVVTFCPLCNSALVFDRRMDGDVLMFGVSGLLRNSDLIMYDRTTETLWQQFTGEAIVGTLAGRELSFIPSAIVSFGDFRDAYPMGEVLSRDTGYNRPYGSNPYVGYDSVDQSPFLFSGPTDGRLPAMERVVTVALEQGDVAYPLSILSNAGVINDRPFGVDVAVFHTPGTSSALGSQSIAAGADVGATGVFSPHLGDQMLTFRLNNGKIVDTETGSGWNVLGQATSGRLSGSQLDPIVHGDHFWFSWAAFKPETLIYGP